MSSKRFKRGITGVQHKGKIISKHSRVVKSINMRVTQTWVLVSTMSLPSCMTLDKSFNIPEPKFRNL